MEKGPAAKPGNLGSLSRKQVQQDVLRPPQEHGAYTPPHACNQNFYKRKEKFKCENLPNAKRKKKKKQVNRIKAKFLLKFPNRFDFESTLSILKHKSRH